MNKLIIGTAILLTACGNDPVTYAGYFDEDMDRSVEENTTDDHSTNYTVDKSQHNNSTTITTIVDSVVFVRDTVTVYNHDTLYVNVKDTVRDTVKRTLNIYDTITVKEIITDTIVKTDTIIKTDTVLKVDTILNRDIVVVYDTIKKANSIDIIDTTIEYCDNANNVKTCREYTGKILGEYFYDIESRPYSTVNNPVCTGEDWHLFNFEDAYLWRDNLGEIISGVDHIVLSKERDGSYNVATRFSQNKHYPGTENLKYKCVLKL